MIELVFRETYIRICIYIYIHISYFGLNMPQPRTALNADSQSSKCLDHAGVVKKDPNKQQAMKLGSTPRRGRSPSVPETRQIRQGLRYRRLPGG